MDPALTAATAAGLIASGALTHTGERLTDSVVALYEKMKTRLSRDPYHAATLSRAEQKPDDPRRVQHLADALTEIMESERDFADLVEELVRAAGAGGARIVQASNSGAVVGGSVYINARNVAGRDLHGR